ncbi:MULTISPECIES: hypothetical protein [Methylobacterium]|uniref:DUF2169 domain-containing protein n=2 Tax=Pseudomonadota TaxID=1224 RepID=A0ABQ4SYS9_9HYPH|nr:MULTISPECIES: hypothetical protein [Methylobacterium]PIU05261.1 MAG: hypothetical protein COT56_15850 [Methylobacterium sp. CG09_land_8_20_14_0_10_71_15]PIU12004.1 MAG: hypothetical protein COT28_17185 [Methylobacterium sp. CG08_land_8_20_14_0_20_71_15]GBU16825.1 hypothetical protein AwMethylo_10400 [Methylobacterium sp.]GJE08370.1 hypothetical protein AOPFMNJM_3707 [Methylobacterium jeotgali]
MTPATHYGIHRQDEFLFLHEQDGGRCLSPGYGRLDSPFDVRVPHWLRCPHRLCPPEIGPVLDHPFARAMGPDQEARLFYVRAADVHWIWRLSAMTPTLHRFVEPYTVLRRPRISRLAPKLLLTNVAPVAITDTEPGDLVELETLAAMPRLRNLIVCGPLKLPGAEVLDPAGLPMNHDWAAEGRRQLYHLIRRS